MPVEQVSDLSQNPVEQLPPTTDCQNCIKLRHLLGKLRTAMNRQELEIINLIKKLEEVAHATEANASVSQPEAAKQDS